MLRRQGATYEAGNLAPFGHDSRGDHGVFLPSFASTSFQNCFAGLPLILSRVLMARRTSASRSGLKSQTRGWRGIPFNGDRSDTLVASQNRIVSGRSPSGDRSATGVPAQATSAGLSRGPPG